MMAEAAKPIQLTPEVRAMVERGMLRVGRSVFPGRKLTVEWEDADILDDPSKGSSDGRNGEGDPEYACDACPR